MAKAKKSEATLTLEEKLEQALIADEEQPYKAPDNWCWTTLKSISNLYNGDRGSNYPSKKDYVTEGVPFINAGAIQNNTLEHIEFNYITQQKYESLRAGKIQKNDILYCLRGSLGKTAIIETDIMGAISSSLCIIRTKKDVLPKYLAYLLRTELITQQQDFAENGSAQPNLSAASVMEYKLPLAPLAEQQRIVDRIERMFSKLDEVKENAQNVIDGFENRKSAILHKAFNGELTAKWREENHIDRELWESKSIADLFTHTTGKALKKDNKEGILHKYITTSNLYWGMFDFTEVRKMYFTDREIDKCTAKKGDLLICNGGDVGRAAIWDYDYDICLQNHISKLRKKQDNLEVRFFFYYFMLSKLKGNINSKGIGISSLSAKDLLAMSVKLPTLQEQIEIVRILDNILLKQQQAKEKAEDVLEKIELIKKSILARAFRGELGTNNPDEESSIELLKTVLSEDKDEKTISKPESK